MNSDTAGPFFCEPATICLADATLLNSPTVESIQTCSSPEEEKKAVKKRKSWGQELPVPKTNLPPRKRAKTEDEKEQRRIERVLRNRQAAQSSRERKRLEVERLESERDLIDQQNHLLKQRLLKVEEEKFKMKQELAEMRALMKKHVGELTPSATPSPLMSNEVFDEKSIKAELDELPSLFSSSQPISIDPKSPVLPATPQSAATPSDLTQHPAAVLCEDLQCQSEEVSPSSRAAQLLVPSDATVSNPWQALAMLLLCLRIHSSVYSTMLSPLSRLLASLKKGSPFKTETITPMLFTLITWLIFNPRSQPKTLTTATQTSTSATTPTSSTPSTSSPSTTRSSTFRTSLLRRLLTCSPALARPLKDATARALREKASYALRGMSDKSCSPIEAGVEGDLKGSGLTKAPKADVWRLMAMALVVDQFIKDRERGEKKG